MKRLSTVERHKAHNISFITTANIELNRGDTRNYMCEIAEPEGDHSEMMSYDTYLDSKESVKPHLEHTSMCQSDPVLSVSYPVASGGRPEPR